MSLFARLASSGRRSSVFAAITAVSTLAAAVSGLSAHDPSGQWLRVLLIVVVLAAAMMLRPPALVVAVFLIGLIPIAVRSLGEGHAFVSVAGLTDLAGISTLGLSGFLVHVYLERLEDWAAEYANPETGIQTERSLRASLEKEIARSRRFQRQFSLMLVGLDRRRLHFDHGGGAEWKQAFETTTSLLRSSRANIDRIFHYGDRSFALILPETGPAEVTGLIRRLNRLARAFNPADGEPDGPTPINFGVTFYPQAATSADDLIRRAEVALRLAEKSPTRVKYDGAEAPDLPDPESLRRADAGLAQIAASAPLNRTAPLGHIGPVSQPLGDALSGLMEHLDATLDLIEEIKSA